VLLTLGWTELIRRKSYSSLSHKFHTIFTGLGLQLTYAFIKKWDHLKAALALHLPYYNFCRKHGSLKGATPAMGAGITDRVLALGDLLSQ
jgi:hypothetical protein